MTLDNTSLELIQDSAKNKRSVFFSADGIDTLFQTYVLGIRDNTVVLANKVPLAIIGHVVKARHFLMQVQMVQFKSDQIDSDGINIIFPLNELKMITQTRQSQRFPFDSEQHVAIELINPYDGKTTIKKTVMDMSVAGLSFRSPFDSCLFEPGLVFNGIKIIIDGVAYNQVNAKVIYKRHFQAHDGKSHVQIGLQFLK